VNKAAEVIARSDSTPVTAAGDVRYNLFWGQGATVPELALGALGNPEGQGPLPYLIQTGGDESAMNPGNRFIELSSCLLSS
jgi:hypothetical protein